MDVGKIMDYYSRIIVIGASAGGVDALLRIVPGLSVDLPAPVLIVLHIGAHRSQLAKLLNAKGPNRAVFAETGMVPQPGTVYVAPPDHHLLLETGSLQLYRGPKEQHARPAINPLFRSAALDYGPRVVGVILSGMMDDGAAGLYAIKACGGTAVVQDPEDAVEPSMPSSALASVTADHVTTVEGMPGLLNVLAEPVQTLDNIRAPEWLRIEHAVSIGRTDMDELARIGNPSAFTCPECGGALFELKEGHPHRFLCHTGHAFSLQSLASTHEHATDDALWAAIRALQEKVAILRRLAEVNADEAVRAEADRLASHIAAMREAVTNMPSTKVVDGSVDA
jgi:two-component system, chemotaxis family, protein-glutamate methylesterase/glutaminase